MRKLIPLAFVALLMLAARSPFFDRQGRKMS